MFLPWQHSGIKIFLSLDSSQVKVI